MVEPSMEIYRAGRGAVLFGVSTLLIRFIHLNTLPSYTAPDYLKYFDSTTKKILSDMYIHNTSPRVHHQKIREDQTTNPGSYQHQLKLLPCPLSSRLRSYKEDPLCQVSSV